MNDWIERLRRFWDALVAYGNQPVPPPDLAPRIAFGWVLFWACAVGAILCVIIYFAIKKFVDPIVREKKRIEQANRLHRDAEMLRLQESYQAEGNRGNNWYG